MEDNAGSFYMYNGELKNADNPVIVDTAKVRTVYEVIRIIKGVPLFLEDHYQRMVFSMESTGRKLETSYNSAVDMISGLVGANGLENCNVKVTVYEQDGRQNVLMYISKSYYPDSEEYRNGVPAGTIKIERTNPNAKIWNAAYKAAVAERIKSGGFFEVLLINKDGFFTEGSKSNAFFIVDNVIVTAPGEYVLKGITRKYILEACKNTGLEVSEKLLHTSGMDKIQGAFISGTSLKALPLSSIDGRKLNVSQDSPVQQVLREYDKIVEKYIEEHSSFKAGKPDIFDDGGCRKTKSRLAVFDILQKLQMPATADEIYMKLKQQGMSTNLSTVYRTLDMLESKGMLEKVTITDGKARYQLSHGHRHHIICTCCNKVMPIDGCPLAELEKNVGKETSFDITGHKLELYGICPDCKKK